MSAGWQISKTNSLSNLHQELRIAPNKIYESFNSSINKCWQKYLSITSLFQTQDLFSSKTTKFHRTSVPHFKWNYNSFYYCAIFFVRITIYDICYCIKIWAILNIFIFFFFTISYITLQDSEVLLWSRSMNIWPRIVMRGDIYNRLMYTWSEEMILWRQNVHQVLHVLSCLTTAMSLINTHYPINHSNTLCGVRVSVKGVDHMTPISITMTTTGPFNLKSNN